MSAVFVHLKQLESYLRFPATASACADWSSAWVMHKSVLRLNLCAPKLCVEEMCVNLCFYCTARLPFYNYEQVVAYG